MLMFILKRLLASMAIFNKSSVISSTTTTYSTKTPRSIGGLRVFSSRDGFSGGAGDVMHYDVTPYIVPRLRNTTRTTRIRRVYEAILDDLR